MEWLFCLKKFKNDVLISEDFIKKAIKDYFFCDVWQNYMIFFSFVLWLVVFKPAVYLKQA